MVQIRLTSRVVVWEIAPRTTENIKDSNNIRTQCEPEKQCSFHTSSLTTVNSKNATQDAWLKIKVSYAIFFPPVPPFLKKPI